MTVTIIRQKKVTPVVVKVTLSQEILREVSKQSANKKDFLSAIHQTNISDPFEVMSAVLRYLG